MYEANKLAFREFVDEYFDRDIYGFGYLGEELEEYRERIYKYIELDGYERLVGHYNGGRMLAIGAVFGDKYRVVAMLPDYPSRFSICEGFIKDLINELTGGELKEIRLSLNENLPSTNYEMGSTLKNIGFILEPRYLMLHSKDEVLPKTQLKDQYMLVDIDGVDSQEIIDCFVDGYKIYKDEYDDINELREYFTDLVNNDLSSEIKRQSFVGVRYNDKLIALCYYDQWGEGAALLDEIVVRSEHSSKGLGRYLMVKAIESMYYNGYKEIHLGVDRRHIGALRLYHGLGFMVYSREQYATYRVPD